jgi:hypothetical protein
MSPTELLIIAMIVLLVFRRPFGGGPPSFGGAVATVPFRLATRPPKKESEQLLPDRSGQMAERLP